MYLWKTTMKNLPLSVFETSVSNSTLPINSFFTRRTLRLLGTPKGLASVRACILNSDHSWSDSSCIRAPALVEWELFFRLANLVASLSIYGRNSPNDSFSLVELRFLELSLWFLVCTMRLIGGNGFTDFLSKLNIMLRSYEVFFSLSGWGIFGRSFNFELIVTPTGLIFPLTTRITCLCSFSSYIRL